MHSSNNNSCNIKYKVVFCPFATMPMGTVDRGVFDLGHAKGKRIHGENFASILFSKRIVPEETT